MKNIKDKKDFEELINTEEVIIFFVHSPWSGTSMNGLQRFKELISSKPDFTFLLIDNSDADGFVYDWLKNQEQTFEANNINLKKQSGSWIHGNGELFGVRNKHLIWFESSIYDQTLAEIEGKSYFKSTK